MEMTAWIMLCLFASIGIVQCGVWLTEALKKPPKLRRGYHIIPLYDDTEKLEVQLRYGLSQIRRMGTNGEHILLLDMGMSEESQNICSKMILGIGEIYICGKEELPQTIAHLDKLQNT